MKHVKDCQNLYSVTVVVQEENPAASHLLRLHHRLEVGEQAHVLAHVRRQHLSHAVSSNVVIVKREKDLFLQIPAMSIWDLKHFVLHLTNQKKKNNEN